MINFEFSNTTEIVFGKGTQEQVGEKIRKYSDCNKVLVVYGSDRIKKNGLFDAVSSSLKQQKIDILELGAIFKSFSHLLNGFLSQCLLNRIF